MNNAEFQGKDKNSDCPHLPWERGPVLCLVFVFISSRPVAKHLTWMLGTWMLNVLLYSSELFSFSVNFPLGELKLVPLLLSGVSQVGICPLKDGIVYLELFGVQFLVFREANGKFGPGIAKMSWRNMGVCKGESLLVSFSL